MGKPDVPICDYEGSPWRTAFWPGREYEDRAERIALRHLLPPRGRRLIEIGAGFGRLADLYRGYDQVILLDYSRSLLREGRERIGRDPRFIYVAADLYQLPLADSAVDTAVTVRVLHHVVDIPRAFGEVARIVRPQGTYVTDYANKRHLKALIEYYRGHRAGKASPFSLDPYEFVALNYDYHPDYINQKLAGAGFQVHDTRAVSTFRIGALKRLVPAPFLASLDGLLQHPTARLQITPSLFLKTEATKRGAPEVNAALWRCPRCSSTEIAEQAEGLACQSCQARYPRADGIYDFKTVREY
ncbi:MAG: methyltransferase domain-containing protein [Anaerolineae bacterium]